MLFKELKEVLPRLKKRYYDRPVGSLQSCVHVFIEGESFVVGNPDDHIYDNFIVVAPIILSRPGGYSYVSIVLRKPAQEYISRCSKLRELLKDPVFDSSPSSASALMSLDYAIDDLFCIDRALVSFEHEDFLLSLIIEAYLKVDTTSSLGMDHLAVAACALFFFGPKPLNEMASILYRSDVIDFADSFYDICSVTVEHIKEEASTYECEITIQQIKS